MRVTKRNLAIGLSLLLLLLGINAAISYFNTQRLIRNTRAVEHTYQVAAQLDAQLSAAQDVETGTRGFIITGDESYLEPYNNGLQNLRTSFGALSSLVRDDPQQLQRAATLKRELERRVAVATRNIALRRSQGFEAVQRASRRREGKRAMDAVRDTVADMKKTEFTLLKVRQQESRRSANAALLSLGIFTLSGILLLSLVSSMLARAELRKAELQRAHARLQHMEAMRDSLTAMLVHDLRTPLTTLLGPLEMLENGSFGQLEEAQKEIIGMSTRSGYRLLGLINELLDISKMEAGEMQVRRETVQVAVVVDAALAQVTRLDNVDHNRIVREVEDDLPIMQADEELLVRVLINLMGNALKFTPSDGIITIAARLAHADEPALQKGYSKSATQEFDFRSDDMSPKNGAKKSQKTHASEQENKHAALILFSVRDTGEGIPAEDQERIFEKFGQVETRQAGRKMSTGLGLTFCKLAVQAHGGHIWVESELGQGSTFFFTVPLRSWLEGEYQKEKATALSA